MNCGTCNHWAFKYVSGAGNEVGECLFHLASVQLDDDGDPCKTLVAADEGASCMGYMPSATPASIIFFPNGLVAVCDAAGKQIPKYQTGWHSGAIKFLARDGHDWRSLNVTGEPLLPHQFADRDGSRLLSE